MPTLEEQISAATVNKSINQWHPTILIGENGRRRAAYVKVSTITRGVATYKIQTIGNHRIGGASTRAIELWRTNRKGEFLTDGRRSASPEYIEDWISRHKEGKNL